MKNKEITAVLELENPNFKRYLIILSFIMISFVYSNKIMAQIESLYNQNSEQFAGISNLMSAVSNNDAEGTRFFSKAGVIIVNQKNKGGATALHIASREGNLDIVKILIENGANPNLTDNEGYTPLMRASLSASPEVVEYLLKNGAKPGIFNSQNETVIIHAASSKCDDCLNILIEDGKLIKTVDTLILKGQIADAMVIANNQDNEKIQTLLHGFLDYVSKSAPLVVKSKSDEEDKPLPFKTNAISKKIAINKLVPAASSEVSGDVLGSNIFEEPQAITPFENKKSISDKESILVKDLTLSPSEVNKSKNDEIMIPEEKYNLKKEIEQKSEPVIEEKFTKISDANKNLTPIQNIPVKKFKFIQMQENNVNINKNPSVLNNSFDEKPISEKVKSQEPLPINVLNGALANKKIDNKATQNGEEILNKTQNPKKFIFKQQNEKSNSNQAPSVEKFKIIDSEAIEKPISETTNALNNSSDDQYFDIRVSKDQEIAQSSTKNIKKFIFKQQIDKSN